MENLTMESNSSLKEHLEASREGGKTAQGADVLSKQSTSNKVKQEGLKSSRRTALLVAFAAILIVVAAIVVVSVLWTRPMGSTPASFSDEKVEALILEVSPTDAAFLQALESPQGKALTWLRNSKAHRNDRNQIIQRFSLAITFYSTNGENWSNSEGWLSDKNECEWFSDASEPCDENGNYIHLEIRNNKLNGILPEELGLLSTLRSLQLPSNGLFGSFPTSLPVSLTNLNLNNNEYEPRALPLSTMNLVNLKTLSLDFNNLTGELPTEIGRLSMLEVLSLAGNRLTAGIPRELYLLKALKSVNFEFNNMSGPIFSEIGQLARLEYFKLNINLFNQQIPTEIGTLKNLKMFACNECALFGALPTEIGFLGKLETLELERNQLEGTLPYQIGYATSLRRVDLSGNAMKGSLPTSLERLTDIKSFDMKRNFVTGTIPSELGGIQSRNFIFHFDSTQLTGSVPSQVCNVLNHNEGIMLIDALGVQPCADCTGCHTAVP